MRFVIALSEFRGRTAGDPAEGAAEVVAVAEPAQLHNPADAQCGFCQVLFRGGDAAGLQIAHDRFSGDFLEKMGQIGDAETVFFRQNSQ